jgi:hypothetical protein
MGRLEAHLIQLIQLKWTASAFMWETGFGPIIFCNIQIQIPRLLNFWNLASQEDQTKQYKVKHKLRKCKILFFQYNVKVINGVQILLLFVILSLQLMYFLPMTLLHVIVVQVKNEISFVTKRAVAIWSVTSVWYQILLEKKILNHR